MTNVATWTEAQQMTWKSQILKQNAARFNTTNIQTTKRKKEICVVTMVGYFDIKTARQEIYYQMISEK